MEVKNKSHKYNITDLSLDMDTITLDIISAL